MIQTYPLISTRRPERVLIYKKKRACYLVDSAVPVEHKVRIKESKKRDKYLDLARELKETLEHEGYGDINCSWCASNIPQRIGKGD